MFSTLTIISSGFISYFTSPCSTIPVDSKLNWNEHRKYVSAKAPRSLNFLCHHLYNSSISIKSIAYKCIVRPVLEYACPVWHLYSNTNVNLLESIQCRAARWASNSRWNPLSYCWSKYSDDCMQELNWPIIKQCHKYFSICHVHDSLHHRSSLPFHNHFQLLETTTRSHPLSIRPIVSTINSYHFSFFVNSPFFGTPCHIPSYRLRTQIYSRYPSPISIQITFSFLSCCVLLCY